jgi:hypothetical protein
MGLLTLVEFRSELLFDLKNRTDTTTSDGFTTARQNMFINAALLHVTHPTIFRHREMMHTYTIPLINGTQAYTFSPDSNGININGIRSIAHVEAATNDPTAQRTKLRPKDEQWFQERTLSSGGTPREFMVRGNTLLLSPVPGANEAGNVLVVSAWREPFPLSLDGDTTNLSTLWDEIVLLAARWRAELHLGYREMAEATKLDWVSLLNEYKSFEDLQGEDWDLYPDLVTEPAMERA